MANGYSNTSTNSQNQNRGSGRNGGNGGKDEIEIYQYGDVTWAEETPMDEIPLEDELEDEVDDLPLEDPPPLINGDIMFEKTIYSQILFRQTVDTSISELKTQREEIDISEFFKHYNKVFFDIPREGEESHTSLLESSKEYLEDYVDPKDSVISDLEEQIKDLEYALTFPDEIPEHPIFTNGMLINEKDVSHSTHIMDQGYRRYVSWDSDMIAALKVAKYGTVDAEIVTITTEAMKAIPKGYPNLDVDNYTVPFDPSLNEVSNLISSLGWEYLRDEVIEGTDATAFNPDQFSSQNEYLYKLEEAIQNKGKVINRLGQFMSSQKQQITALKNLDPDFFNATYGDVLNENLTFVGTGDGSNGNGSGGGSGRANTNGNGSGGGSGRANTGGAMGGNNSGY